jgi:undecaprenyl-diphosphatase
MTFFQAFLLGAVQGIAEFLPISSSAHVALASQLLDLPLEDNTFSVFLNIGSILAVMVYFGRHMLSMFSGSIDFITNRKTKNRYFFATIVLSSLPVIFIFGILEIVFKVSIDSVMVQSVMMIFFATVLYLCDQNPADKKNISRKDSILVGFAQVLSFVPGVSRLGSCLSMMRYLRYSREESFRYSMLLSIPPVLGACSVKLMQIFAGKIVIENWSMVLIGSVSAFAFGLISLFFMVRFFRRYTLLPIIIYRAALGVFLMLQELSRDFPFFLK